ncbi:hypothetical protein AT984_06230 [Paucibacter sp. KCTC 42545]|nr:hypothetical protein AT984_06230 [Paucibacter sp. KCTC 42545]
MKTRITQPARHSHDEVHTARGPALASQTADDSSRQTLQREQIAQLKGVGAPGARNALPAALAKGIAQLSGVDLAGVNVHRNSAKPAQLNALAYAQGQDIHLGPGQEQHLPHEAWHLVQQAQGRVSSTRQLKGTNINDDEALEREADQMGERALQQVNGAHESGCACGSCLSPNFSALASAPPQQEAVQLMCDRGHAFHNNGPCPDGDVLDRTQERGVKLGNKHKASSKKSGVSKSTAKVQERIERHINAAVQGNSSKATYGGREGQNLLWEVARATQAKQALRGSRRVLQHPGGGGEDDPLDLFEDGRGNHSDTDSESDSE